MVYYPRHIYWSNIIDQLHTCDRSLIPQVSLLHLDFKLFQNNAKIWQFKQSPSFKQEFPYTFNVFSSNFPHLNDESPSWLFQSYHRHATTSSIWDMDQEQNQSHSRVKYRCQGNLVPCTLWSTTQDTSTDQISLVYYF